MPGDVVPEPQICRRIDLMEFLAFEEGAVVLEPERHDSADSDAHASPRLEFPLVLGTGEIALQRGVGEQLDRTKTSLESWRQLEGPRALAERRPRRLVFGAESKSRAAARTRARACGSVAASPHSRAPIRASGRPGCSQPAPNDP